MRQEPRAPSVQGPAEWFHGDVWLDPIVVSDEESPLALTAVHFAPGSRTAWHSHQGGQTLYVTEGRGLVQSRGEHVVELRAGDVHVTADGEEHWHGARRDHALTHLAITRGPARWGAHVDESDVTA